MATRSEIRSLLFSAQLEDLQLGLLLMRGQGLTETMRPELSLLWLLGPAELDRRGLALELGGFSVKMLEDYFRQDPAYGSGRFDALERLSRYPGMDEEVLMAFGCRYHPVQGLHRFFLERADRGQFSEWMGNKIKCRLAGQGLRVLPPGLEGQHAVEDLDVRRNDLEALPEWMGSLMALKRLDLSHNPLRTWPGVLAALPALSWLGLESCRLEELRGLEGCRNLKVLNVAFNPGLDPSAFRLVPDGLEELDLRGLPVVECLSVLKGHPRLCRVRVGSLGPEEADCIDDVLSSFAHPVELLN
jgi:hypothetical protein